VITDGSCEGDGSEVLVLTVRLDRRWEAVEAYPGCYNSVLAILKLFGGRAKSTNMKRAILTVRAGEPITGPLGKKTAVGCHRWSVVGHTKP